jgi:hypothetical protein
MLFLGNKKGLLGNKETKIITDRFPEFFFQSIETDKSSASSLVWESYRKGW